MVLKDNNGINRYTYNAAGERIMKSYGTMEAVYINGAPQGITFHETDNFILQISSMANRSMRKQVCTIMVQDNTFNVFLR